MIIARLTRETDRDGRPYLAGRTTSNWPHKVGTPLVLRRVGSHYELIELGPRDTHLSPDALASFVDVSPTFEHE